MGDGRDKGRFGRVQFLEFRNVLQQDHIPQFTRLILFRFCIDDGDIRCLEITLFIVSVYLQRFFLLARRHQFTNQTAEKIVLQSKFFRRFTDYILTLHIQYIQCFLVDKQDFALHIQTDNGVVYTVHNRFYEFLCRKDVRQSTGTVFSQTFRHPVETIGHFTEFLIITHIQTLLIIMAGYFEDSLFQFLYRFADTSGKPIKQYQSGQDTDTAGNGNPQQRTFQSGHGGRAVRFSSRQDLKIHY